MLLFMWPGRQMGINCVSESYFAFARYIKCDIKLSRRSYCWIYCLSDTVLRCRDLKSLCWGKWTVYICKCRLWKNSVSLTSSVLVITRNKGRSSEQRPASNDPQNTYFLKIMALRTGNQTDLCHLMGIHSRTQPTVQLTHQQIKEVINIKRLPSTYIENIWFIDHKEWLTRKESFQRDKWAFAPFLSCREKFSRRMFSDPGGKFPGFRITLAIQAENITLRNRI